MSVTEKEQKAKIIQIHPRYSKLQRRVVYRTIYGEYRLLILGVGAGLVIAVGAILLSHYSK